MARRCARADEIGADHVLPCPGENACSAPSKAAAESANRATAGARPGRRDQRRQADGSASAARALSMPGASGLRPPSSPRRCSPRLQQPRSRRGHAASKAQASPSARQRPAGGHGRQGFVESEVSELLNASVANTRNGGDASTAISRQPNRPEIWLENSTSSTIRCASTGRKRARRNRCRAAARIRPARWANSSSRARASADRLRHRQRASALRRSRAPAVRRSASRSACDVTPSPSASAARSSASAGSCPKTTV